MNINHIIPTKNLTITGLYVRNTCNELIKLQNETKQKYINFYNNLQDHPALCNKFLFLNSVFNIALRESSNFRQTEYLYNLLAEFIAECNNDVPEALAIFDNELWSHCILINTHIHDNQFMKAVKNTLSLPIRLLLDSATEKDSYSSINQYLCGADPDLSLTESYEAFLNAVKIDKTVVFKGLEQVRTLLISSLPSKNIYYILKFYLAVAFNSCINIEPFQVTQYADVCKNLVIIFLNSNKSIDEEIILLILDIHKTHKVNKQGESIFIEGFPTEGQWKLVDYFIYNSIYELIKGKKFQDCKDKIFVKFVDSCMRYGIASHRRWIARACLLIQDRHISDSEAQYYLLKTLNHFYTEGVVNSYFIKNLTAAISKTSLSDKAINLLNNLALLGTQVEPIINKSSVPDFVDKGKNIFTVPGKELWELINKEFIARKMVEENLTLGEVAEILRNLHVSTDLSIIRQVIKQLEVFDGTAENYQPQNNILMLNFLYSHAFYFEPDKIVRWSEAEPFPLFCFRMLMKGKFQALKFIKTSYIFDGESKIVFVSDDKKQFTDLTSFRPDNTKFYSYSLTMIDITDPKGKDFPLPINSQTLKTFPRWVIKQLLAKEEAAEAERLESFICYCRRRTTYTFEIRDLPKVCKEIDYYKNLLDKDQIKELVINLIENYVGITNHKDRVRDPSAAFKLLQTYTDLLGERDSKELLIELLENCSGINCNNDIRSLSESGKLLRNFKNLLGKDETKRFVIKLLKNCSGIDSNDSIRGSSEARELLISFKGLLGKELVKQLVINLIENCSGLSHSDRVREPSVAFKLLQTYADLLGERDSKELLIELLENCSGINSNDSIRGSSEARELLISFKSLLGKELVKQLVINLIENCAGISHSDQVREPSAAFKLLQTYANLIGNGKAKELVTKLIENCSGIDCRDNIRELSEACELLISFKSLLSKEETNRLVTNLIGNCSAIYHEGNIRDATMALKLLERFGNQLSDIEFNALGKALIKNYSTIDPSEVVRESHIALELLEKFGNHLESETSYHALVKILIENYSNLNIMEAVRDARIALDLLNKNKVWLSNGENHEFYANTVNNLFTNIQSSDLQKLNELLDKHGNVINENVIRNKYMQTDSIRLIEAIIAYVQGSGRHRRINLPPRIDMLVNGQPLAGIAFEVHRFTDGIESIVLKAIDDFLKALKVPTPKFTINNLRDNLTLIEDEQLRTKADHALNKMLGSDTYKARLEFGLPTIAAFLNLDHNTWETDYQAKDTRWSMWLTQSLVEAGTAYDSSRYSTSCVKGIYERLFTGFRTMHPIVDCIFVAQNVAKGFEQNIVNLLKKEKLIQNVILSLKKQGVKGTEKYFNNKLRQAYAKGIEQQFKHRVDKNLTPYFNKLIAFGTLKSYLAQEVTERSIPIINNTLKKINDSLDNLEYIEVNEGDNALTLEDYIKDQLAEKK
jgi:hypothetical protein